MVFKWILVQKPLQAMVFQWFLVTKTIGSNSFPMVLGLKTIGTNGFCNGFVVWQPLDTMFFKWFSMVAIHWSDDGMVTIHRSGLSSSDLPSSTLGVRLTL